MLFCDKYRDEVKSNIIALQVKHNRRRVAPPKDVARHLGEKWRNADLTCKKEFVDRFNLAYEKYKIDLALWKTRKNHSVVAPSQGTNFEYQKKSRRFTDPQKPRPPHNPFMRFCNHYRNIIRDEILSELTSEHKVAPPKEVARRLGERWRKASESEKAIFQDAFSEEYTSYREALEEYKKKYRGNILQLVGGKRAREQEAYGRGRKKRPYRTDPDKPKPPHNAFMLFCNKFREDVKMEVLNEQACNNKLNEPLVAPPKEVARRLGKRWREAKQVEKSEFIAAFKSKYSVYKNALACYTQAKKKMSHTLQK
jgi:hypothetical protein